MKRITSLLILLILTGCCFWADSIKEPTAHELAVFKKDSLQVVESREKLKAALKYSLAQLDSLTSAQKEALAVLLIINSETAGLTPGDHRKDIYKKELASAINEFLKKPLVVGADYKNVCLNEEIAYASAVARCEQDGKTEDECPEAWTASAASMNCAMREIDVRLDRVRALVRGGNPLPDID